MLEQDELDQLRGGAECRIHYHPKDFPDINDLVNLQAVNPGLPVTGDVTLGNEDSLILVDTSGGDITITMPPAASGREYQIIKTDAAFIIYVVPAAGETILGSATGIAITLFGTCVHLKATTNNDWMAI